MILMNNGSIKVGQQSFYCIRSTCCEGQVAPAGIDILLRVKAKLCRQMLIYHLQYMWVIASGC